MHPILFSFGPLTVYTYGFCIFLGVLAAYFYGAWLGKARYGIGKDDLADIAFWGLVFGFLSARGLYILTEFPAFLTDPMPFLLTTSGFVFLGGLIGATVTAYVVCRKRAIDVMSCFDLLACVIPLAHAFGRIGCFFYGCCFGAVKEHGGFLCFVFPEGSPAGFVAQGHPVFAAQLVESAALLALTALMFSLHTRIRVPGMMACVYAGGYGTLRFMLEFLRGDIARGYVGVLSTSQWISGMMMVAALIAGVVLYRRHEAAKAKE
jgi:phosphatidylglycerol:prolipoprotein diacylglycerol transferase